MAEDDVKEAEEGAQSDEEGEEGEEGGAPKKKKKLLLIVGVVVVLGAIAGGLFASGMLSGGGEEEAEVDPNTVPQIVYYDMKEFLVNLNNPGRQVTFLKMTVTLELPNLASRAEVESKTPRIRDSFQVYLRELRNSDLQGSAGLQRLREELLLRINKIITPHKVNDILFKEIIVQ